MKLFKSTSGKKSKLRILGAVVALGLVFGIGWMLFNPTDTSAAWYGGGWSYRKQLTIDKNKVSGGADLSNFPVLVSLTDTNLSKALSTGNDILFTSSDGTTKLSHEIESFTQSTGELVAWVKVPTVSSSANTRIYVYWGNSTASSQQDATNVWDTSTKAVWHMNATTGTSIPDSTGVNTGTKTSSTTPVTMTGQISGAQNFLASNSTDKIDAGSNSSLNNTTQTLTFSAWIKRRTSSSGGYIMARGTSGASGYGFGIGNVASSGCGTNTITASKFGIVHACIGAVPADTSWHYIAVVWTSSGATPYIDGAVSSPTNANTTSITTSSNNARIGVHPGGAQDYFDGGIDEIQIASTNRTAGWIATEYNNQSSPTTFFTVSDIETNGGPVLYWKFDEGTGTTANDATVNNNTGTLAASTSTPTWVTEDQCINGKCLKFDGSNDYLSRTYSSDTELDPGTGSFSISTWFKHNTTTLSAAQYIMQRYTAAGYNITMNTDGTVCFNTDDDASFDPDDYACSTASFKDSKWHFLEAVKSGTSSITLYIDGVQVGQDASLSATASLSGTTPVVSVGATSSGTFSWDGFIDEFKMYDFAKTANQVKNDYASKGTIADTATSFGAGDQSLNLSQGLVGYWKMDESSWTNNCSTTSITDSSGNGNNGRACPNTTGPTGAAAGNFASAGSFDGTNDYILLPSSTSLSSVDNSSAWTISTWINPTTLSTNAILYGSNQDNNNQTIGVLLNGNGTTTSLIVRTAGCNAGTTTVTLNQALSTATWQLLSITRNKQNVNVYKNGVLIGTSSSYLEGCQSGNNMVIGGSPTWTFGDSQATTYFSGKLDDFRLYSRALSNNELQALYNWGPGPSAYWKLDDHTGTTALDSSGNGNSGTLTNGPTWTPGKYGSSVNFDGTNDYIVATDNSTLQFGAGESISLEAWIKTTNGDANIISKNGEDISNVYQLRLAFGCVRVSAKDGSFVGSNDFTSNTCGLNDDNWHHVAYTFDRTTLGAKLYVDGVLDNSETESSPGTIGTTIDNVFIGSSEGTTSYFTGKIDEVRMYKYARTQKQIIQDKSAGSPMIGGAGSPSTTVGYWSFDETRGTTANDKSGNSNNLTLSSASWTTSGKFASAWNGTGSLWLTRSDDDNFDFVATDDFTISTWFKSDSATNPSSGTAQFLISKGTITNTGTVGYAIWTDNNGFINFGIRSSSGAWGASSPGTPSANDTAATATDFYDGNWHQLVATKTGTSRIDIYIDGVLKGSDTSLTATGTLANSIALRVADDDADATNSFAGDLDELKIYRYALNSDEIKADYNQGASQSISSLSTDSTGTVADNSAARAYCVPGDSSTCNAPFAEWKLDEGTGTSAFDTSGNGNTGTLTNSPTWTQGKVGKGLLFSSSSSKYVTIPDANSLDNNGAMTIEAWVKPTSTTLDGNYHDIVGKGDSSNASSAYTLSITQTNKLSFYWSAANVFEEYQATYSFVAGQWYHVVGTRNAGLSAVSFYINGTKYTGTSTLNNAGGGGSTDPVAIGRSGSYTSQYFDGVIDQVRLYDYERSQAQVMWSYNQGGPIGWWKLDECSGTTAYDASGNANNGTITIGATGTYTSAGTCNSGTSTHSWNGGTTGKYSSSVAFDGTDDLVSIPDSTPLNITADISLEAWVKPSALNSAYHEILFKGSTTSTPANRQYALRLNSSNQWEGCLTTTTPTESCITDNKITPSTTSWTHLVFTRSGSTATIYTNGVATGTGTISGTLNATSNILAIGRTGASGQEYFNGLIDNVKIYNYALTQKQVQTAYNENSAVRFGQ